MQALKTEKIKVLTVNPAQTSTPMTWSRPDAEYLPDKMIQPDEIAEAIMMTFKLGPNVFIEVRRILNSKPSHSPIVQTCICMALAVHTACFHSTRAPRATVHSCPKALTVLALMIKRGLSHFTTWGACAGDHG